MSLTSVIRYIRVLDSAAADGSGKTGLVFGDFTAKYVRQGGTLTSVTPETITTLGTYQAPTANTNIRIKELSSSDPAKGVYEVHFHNDQVTSSGVKLWLFLSATGAISQPLEMDLAVLTSIQDDTDAIEVDTQDIQSRLPAALTTDSLMKCDTLRVGGTTQTARDLGLALPAAAPNANGGLPILSTSGTTLAYTVSTLTTYTGNTPQTGDAYAVVNSGTFGNAAIKTETAAIQADTNDIQARLPAALVGGRIDASVGEMTVAALKDFFDTDSTTTYASAVAGSVVKEIASNTTATVSGTVDANIVEVAGDSAAADNLKNVNNTVGGSFTVTTGDINLDGGFRTVGAFTVDGGVSWNAATIGDLTINNDLTVSGSTSLNDLFIAGSVGITGGLGVGGDTTFSGLVTMTTGLTAQELNLTNDLSVGGNVILSGAVSVASDVTINGTLSILTDLTVSGNVNLGGNLAITDNLSVGAATLFVGNVIMASQFEIDGPVTATHASNDIRGVTVKDASITSAKFSVSTITGVASGFLEKMDQLWRRFFKRVKKTGNASGTIETFADNGTTVLTTQNFTSSGGTDDVGAAS